MNNTVAPATLLSLEASDFLALADHLPHLVWMAGPDGWIHWYNQQWYSYTGTTPQEMEGWGWQSVHDPAVLPRVLERWKAAIAAGEPFEMVFPIRGADGSFRPFLTRVRPLKDEQGRITRWIGTNTDISEQQRIAENLAEEKGHLKTLNQTIAQVSAELDLQRLVQTVTDAGVHLTGAQFGAFFYTVPHGPGEALTLYTISGVPPENFSKFPNPRATHVFGPTFRGEGPVRSDDILADPRYGRNAPYKGMPEGHLPVRSYLAVPVKSRSGEVMGGLFFGHPEPSRFTARHEELLTGIAGQAAIGIDNARLYDAGQREIAERRESENHRELLINELNHRVKNTLATVQSIAAQTLRNSSSMHEAKDALESRLLALSRAHDVLTRENWDGANLYDIVAQAVAPYSSPGEDRLHLKGPSVRLPPRMALALAMALQELATNAVKYGALSNLNGEILIEWKLEQSARERRLHLVWAESGGPPVQEPSHRGFGTRLIERSLAQDLGGEVKVSFEPSGLVCTVDAALQAS